MTTSTRTQLMDAFAAQLAAAGYPGISLLEVARTVGIRKPSIYHHFPGGKEELYTAVALRFVERLHERVAAAVATPGGTADRLRALALAAAEHGDTAISFEQRVYDALEHVTEDARSTVSQRYVAAVLDPVVALFAEAVAAGEVTGDPAFLMNAFLHLARAVPAGDEDAATAAVRLFLDGARPR